VASVERRPILHITTTHLSFGVSHGGDLHRLEVQQDWFIDLLASRSTSGPTGGHSVMSGRLATPRPD
jgi:hypothetical protein